MSIKSFFLLLLSVLFLSNGFSQSLLRDAHWMTKENQLILGQVVLPERLLGPNDNILCKETKGYSRYSLQDLDWLVVGQDTVLRCYSDTHPNAGCWQMLVGGTYDLYIQKVRSTESTIGGIPLSRVGWLQAFLANKQRYAYTLQQTDSIITLNSVNPALTVLQEATSLGCSATNERYDLVGISKMWHLGQHLNHCTTERISYLHRLQGPRWELSLGTILTTLRREIDEQSRHSWSGRLTVSKPLPSISRQLALQLGFGFLNYRQRHELLVGSSLVSGGDFIVLPQQVGDSPNYESFFLQNNGVLNLGLRWLFQPDAFASLLLMGGGAYQFPTNYQVEAIAIGNEPLLGGPITATITKEITGGWSPYVGLGTRVRLRYDWHIELQLRYDPVIHNLGTRDSGHFTETVRHFAANRAVDAFGWRMELALSKLVF